MCIYIYTYIYIYICPGIYNIYTNRDETKSKFGELRNLSCVLDALRPSIIADWSISPCLCVGPLMDGWLMNHGKSPVEMDDENRGAPMTCWKPPHMDI